MSIEAEINEKDATYTVTPDHGLPVVFEVRWRLVNISKVTRNRATRFVVGLKGSDGDGFSHHMLFERACRSALWRARRYEKAYSVPRSPELALKAAS